MLLPKNPLLNAARIAASLVRAAVSDTSKSTDQISPDKNMGSRVGEFRINDKLP